MRHAVRHRRQAILGCLIVLSSGLAICSGSWFGAFPSGIAAAMSSIGVGIVRLWVSLLAAGGMWMLCGAFRDTLTPRSRPAFPAPTEPVRAAGRTEGRPGALYVNGTVYDRR